MPVAEKKSSIEGRGVMQSLPHGQLSAENKKLKHFYAMQFSNQNFSLLLWQTNEKLEISSADSSGQSVVYSVLKGTFLDSFLLRNELVCFQNQTSLFTLKHGWLGRCPIIVNGACIGYLNITKRVQKIPCLGLDFLINDASLIVCKAGENISYLDL